MNRWVALAIAADLCRRGVIAYAQIPETVERLVRGEIAA